MTSSPDVNSLNDFSERRRNKFNICLINARSIFYKLPSLLETLNEIDVDICMLTETWLRNDPHIERSIEDFENKYGYSFIRRDRPPCKRGGGVAICYNKDLISMARIKLPPTKNEMVGAIGRRVGQRRKVASLAVYLPPALKADQVKKCLSEVNDAIIHIKNKYNDPFIMVGGDFNRTDIKRALADHSDISQILTAPTRGTNILDIIATNFNDILVDSGVTEPIQSETGVPSDHLTVYASFKMSRVPDYRVEEYSYYQVNEEGSRKFGQWLVEQDWTGVTSVEAIDNKVEALHQLFQEGITHSFGFRTRKKKSSEPVWMTDGIRDMIRRRRKMFKKMKRRGNWRVLKDRVSAIVEERKKVNNERILEGFLNNKNPRDFHRAVKKLLGENEPPRWKPQQMYPEASNLEAAENIAEYFNSISQEYDPLLNEQIPTTYSRQIPRLTCEEVAKRLKDNKKCNSTVPGDLFPSLYQTYHQELAIPVTHIFNMMLEAKVWPLKWKTEYVTIIPKIAARERPAECRNISCTNFLSKVFERIILDMAREEVVPKLNQFGGEPKASTTHLLMSVLDYTINALEDNRSAVVLSAIDFSKAFNRLAHAACLKTFAKKGTSTEVISLLAAFLSKRQMTVKVEKEWSQPRAVNAGAPQGSVLGCYLFNIGIDDLEEGVNFSQDATTETREHLTRTDNYPTFSTPTRVRPTTANLNMSPIVERDYEIDFLPRIANIPPWIRSRAERKWKEEPILTVKFVDDGINAEKINMKEVPLMIENQARIKLTHADKTGQLLEHMRSTAEEKGLLVNEQKTSLMCISAARSFQAKVGFDYNGQAIEGSDHLKVLGVTINNDCSFKTHTANIAKKLRSKTWALGKLRKKGMQEKDLVKTYQSLIRPSAEYACPAWHSLITIGQSEHIERQQSQALKNIYGVGISAQKMCLKSGIERLWKRREKACRNFAKKNITNPRCSGWFVARTAASYPRRAGTTYRTYNEPISRTDRHRNSPINYARRLLNE